MKFEIGTNKLAEMLSKVEKGVGNGKILAITAYLRLNINDGNLSITSTDLSNYVTVIDQLEGADGEVIVKADAFIQLVKKTSAATMKFEVKGNVLAVKGNGNYKLPILENAEYPFYDASEFTEENSSEFNVKELITILETTKSSIAQEMIVPYLSGYNVGENCVATDSVRMTVYDKEVIKGARILLPQAVVNLLRIIDEETVRIYYTGNKVLFDTERITIFGTQLDGIENYPDVKAILDTFSYANKITIKKADIMSALDRLSIFLDVFANNGVFLKVGAENLVLTDMGKNSEEIISYVEKANVEADLLVNLKFLAGQIDSLTSESVSIFFDEEGGTIKIEGNKDVTHILCLMSDTTEE